MARLFTACSSTSVCGPAKESPAANLCCRAQARLERQSMKRLLPMSSNDHNALLVGSKAVRRRFGTEPDQYAVVSQ